jgi:hypothetical protein
LHTLIEDQIPLAEIGKRCLSAVVIGALRVKNTYALLGHNLLTVVTLVSGGAGTYFLVLLGISGRFHVTVKRNLPFELLVSSWKQ